MAAWEYYSESHSTHYIMSSLDIPEAARKGNPDAIAIMMNKYLKPKGITVKASAKENSLFITAVSSVTPKQDALVAFIKRGIAKIQPGNVSRIIIQGQVEGMPSYEWQEIFSISNEVLNAASDQKESLRSNSDKKISGSRVLLKSQDSSGYRKLKNFLKSRTGERSLIITGTFLVTSIFWLSTWLLSSMINEGKNTLAKTSLSTISVDSKNGEDFSLEEVSEQSNIQSHTEDEIFTPKDIPTLGNTYQQLKDQDIVFQIALVGKTTDGITQIPETSMAGVKPNPIAVKEGYPPEGTDICNLPYSALIKEMYEQCFHEGMTYVQVSNIVGWQGEEVASSGSTSTYQWGDGDSGTMTLTFENDKLLHLSQNNLKP